MGSLFAKPKKIITEQERAILNLKLTRDKITQYSKRIVPQLERERINAQKLLKDGKKDKALLILKKKRRMENLIDQTNKQLSTIEGLINQIEFSQIQVKVAEGLKQGNEALSQLQKLMSLDDVQKIMDDSLEAKQYQDEVSALLGGSLTDEEQAQIDRELDALTEASTADELPQVPTKPIDRMEEKEPSTPQPSAAKARPRQAMLAS